MQRAAITSYSVSSSCSWFVECAHYWLIWTEEAVAKDSLQTRLLAVWICCCRLGADLIWGFELSESREEIRDGVAGLSAQDLEQIQPENELLCRRVHFLSSGSLKQSGDKGLRVLSCPVLSCLLLLSLVKCGKTIHCKVSWQYLAAIQGKNEVGRVENNMEGSWDRVSWGGTVQDW
jgi:hypothetical protein